MSGKVHFYRDSKGDHRWRTVARNGRNQGNGGEGYTKRRGATSGAVDVSVAIFNDPHLGPLVRKKLGLP
jgi:uncharacterized protein YegP (UPF0339 family)